MEVFETEPTPSVSDVALLSEGFGLVALDEIQGSSCSSVHIPEPTINPLRAIGPHDEADAWFDTQDAREAQRRREIINARYWNNGKDSGHILGH